ncbi:thioredoxin family protein [Singulisphaera rosea]
MTLRTSKAAAMLGLGLILSGPVGDVWSDEAKPTAKVKRESIYDAKADAEALMANAAAKAKRENTRILLMFGGDWCGWCHKLHGLFKSDPEIATLLRNEYVLVPVDTQAPNAGKLLDECKAQLVAQGDKNVVGYPFLAVLDADRKVVTAQRTDPLEEGDHHDPKKVNEFLARWKADPLDADKVLETAMTQASEQDKRIILHFGAPWCGWCHKLDDFLAREEIARILGPDYIDLKIDLDRMTGAKAIQKRFRPDESGGIPWIAILDAKGEVLATSDGPKGNIGHPAKPEEIAHFLDMLKKTARKLEPGQIDRIGEALGKGAGSNSPRN